jgi:DNA-directed RNA polymerase subunit RPC12/RpoP
MTTRDERAREGETPRIEVQCLNCGRFGSFNGDDSRVRGTPLVELTKRLRCSACGSRAVRATRVRSPRDIARLLRGRMKPDAP